MVRFVPKFQTPPGRFIILKVIIEENVYILVNIYAPNKDKEIIKFLDDLITVTRKENLDEEENFIVGGDFNCPFNPTLDKKGGLLQVLNVFKLNSISLIFGGSKIQP